MTRNTYRMPFAQWVYHMAQENVGAHGRILAIHAAIFDITGNDELCEITGLSLSTLDKWKKQLKKGGWVIIRPGGGRGLGTRVDPAYRETPITFTDVSARDPEKYRLLNGAKPTEQKPPLSPETTPTVTYVSAETPSAKTPVSIETPPTETGVSSRALALIETPLGLLTSLELKVESEVSEVTPLPPKGGGLTKYDAQIAFDAYNAVALHCGLQQAAKFTPDRQRAILARLKLYGLDGWHRALANIEKSAFLQGQTEHGFRTTLDFVCQAKSFNKLHDGGYGNGAHAQPKESSIEQTFRLCAEAEARIQAKEIAS